MLTALQFATSMNVITSLSCNGNSSNTITVMKAMVTPYTRVLV